VLLATAALVGASFGAPASAQTVRDHNVASPGAVIACWAVMESAEIECTAPYLPDVGALDTYLAVGPRGRASIAERGDFPGFATPQRTLRYGDMWKRPGVRCAMRRTGLTCRNRDGHGFRIQKGHVRRF
jgi:hypothetical protein